MSRRPPTSTSTDPLLPCTTLFLSGCLRRRLHRCQPRLALDCRRLPARPLGRRRRNHLPCRGGHHPVGTAAHLRCDDGSSPSALRSLRLSQDRPPLPASACAPCARRLRGRRRCPCLRPSRRLPPSAPSCSPRGTN